MKTREDEAVGRWLLGRGVVDENALRHVRALRRRGAERVPFTDILLELEKVSPEVLADALAEMSGAERWDGAIDPRLRTVDLEQASAARRAAGKIREAVVVSFDGSTVRYATAKPHDETLRDGVRFATGARRAESRCATDEELARARAALGFDLLPSIADAELRTIPSISEEARREGWTADEPADEPWQRFPAVLLLDLAAPFAGACFRVERFDEPAVRAGKRGRFDRLVSLPGTASTRERALELAAQRIAFMAGLPPGDGQAHGTFRLRMKGRDLRFGVERCRTARGMVLLVRRALHWLGDRPPDEPAFDAYRAAAVRAQELERAGDVDGAVAAHGKAAEAAVALGSDADIERLASSWAAGNLLDEHDREADAKPLLSQALELARQLGLGRRLEGTLTCRLASTEIDDAERRGRLFRLAEQALDADGPARDPVGFMMLERVHAELALGASEAVAGTALQILEHEVAWYGAPTGLCFAALAARAEAEIISDDLERAAGTLAEARDLAARLVDLDAQVDWLAGQLAFARRQDTDAVALLSRALGAVRPARVAAFVRADLALALERVGRTGDAKEQALGATAELEMAPAQARGRRQALTDLLRRIRAYR